MTPHLLPVNSSQPSGTQAQLVTWRETERERERNMLRNEWPESLLVNPIDCKDGRPISTPTFYKWSRNIPATNTFIFAFGSEVFDCSTFGEQSCRLYLSSSKHSVVYPQCRFVYFRSLAAALDVLWASYLVKLWTLYEVDRRFTLFALQPQYVVCVAPTQNGWPLDVCAVHAPNT